MGNKYSFQGERPMKKLLFISSFLVLAAVLSCQSSGPAPTPVAQQAGTTPGFNQDLPEEYNAAMAKAAEARKRAVDFESSSYFPSEWDAAEAQYTQARQIPTDADVANHEAIARSSSSDISEAISRYNAVSGTDKAIAALNTAADTYDSVFKLAVPLYAQAREDEIMALRNSLVAAGARTYFPEPFSSADKTALTALDQYEADDYYAARDTAAQALKMYQILTSAYNAWLVRGEIEEREFESYDPDNFEHAGGILDDAMNAYKAENYASAQGNADEALLRYNLVLSAGWAAYAELRSSMAEAERQAALDIKANIAVRDLFSEADETYKTGEDAFGSKKYEEAAKQFINSEAMFILSSTSAAEKRHTAVEMMREANRRIEESDETARQAEIILEGGAE
jgi:hypothetical protein